MNQLERITSEDYWEEFLSEKMLNAFLHEDQAMQSKDDIHHEVMTLIKLLKNEIPDYSTRFPLGL